MPLFFISYKREDQDFALEIKRFIELQKDKEFLAWIDHYGIHAGDEWKRVIDTAIKQSIGVIVIVTPKSIESPYVTYEWSYAMGLGKPIIPILLHEPTPDQTQIHDKIKDLHMLNFTSSDRKQQDWEALTRKLQGLAQRFDVPPAIEHMKRVIYENVYDRQKWNAILDTLFNFRHAATNDVFAELMALGLPEISLRSLILLAEKSEYTDARVLDVLQQMIEEGFNEILSNGLELAETIRQYDDEKAFDTFVDLINYYPKTSNSLVDLHISLSRMSTQKTIPLICSYLKEYGSSKGSYFPDPQTRLLITMLVRYGQESVPFILEIVVVVKQNSADYRYSLREFIGHLSRLRTNGYNDHGAEYDPIAVDAVYEALQD